MKMMNIAGMVPIPNHKIENGIQAIGGIGLKILITKVHKSSKVLYHPSKIPKGIAIIAARAKPPNTLNNESIVFFKSFPETINSHADSQTVIGPGRIYGSTKPNPSVIKYQKMIITIGKINEIHLRL